MRSKEEILTDAKARIEHLEYFENYAMLKEKQRGDLALMKELVALVEEQQQWIPCSERLPEDKENPITRDYYAYPVIVEFDRKNEKGLRDIRFYQYGNNHWWLGCSHMDKYVTHWLDIHSLSKPYKGEQE